MAMAPHYANLFMDNFLDNYELFSRNWFISFGMVLFRALIFMNAKN